MASYQNFVYNPPLVIDIYVDSTFSAPKFWPGVVGAYIGMAPAPSTAPRSLAVNLAHEFFHACQQNTDLDARDWMERQGEVARRVHGRVRRRHAWHGPTCGGSAEGRPFDEEGVVLDDDDAPERMGDEITRDFLTLPLTIHADGAQLGARLPERPLPGVPVREDRRPSPTSPPSSTS